MGGGRKLISLWLCSLALTACTDTLDEADVPKPLSVAVNARDITARAPIHGTALPDASNIGISLVAEDGTPYDGVTYDNLKYTATGTAPDQSWSTTNVPTLSSSPAKLVAYYPWAENTYYSAVPVETDTQTDYMYSQWLTGLSNAKPNANIVMKHALTAVRVALVKGDFTADVDVSSVSVKSLAFATAGVMDATTGALSALTGIGDAVTVAADFPLTAQATNVEVMAVPDVSVSFGVTTVTTQIGDRKYSVNINFTESYKQGYIYTYTLTLNNTGMEVTSVAVTPWEEGTTDAGDLVMANDQYIVDIAVQADAYTYTHNILGFAGTVNWGDGTTTVYGETSRGIDDGETSVTNYPTHTYTTAGTYRVVATGMATALNSTSASKCITDIIKIGGDMGITTMEAAFQGQTKLTEIHAGIFDELSDVDNFRNVLKDCSTITALPEGLFDKCTEIVCLEGFAAYCTKLSIIPDKLLYKLKKLTKAGGGLRSTAITYIPEDFFYYNKEIVDLGWFYHKCSNLTGSIPENLFKNNSKIENLAGIFSECKNLTGIIPSNLFVNNPEILNINQLFYDCSNLSGPIPENLFFNNEKIWNMTYVFCRTFNNSTEQVEIPAKIFQNKPALTTLERAFYEAKKIKPFIPAGLFDECPELTSLSEIWWGSSIGGATIPEGLLDNNTKLENMQQTFGGCKGTVPAGLFDNCPDITNFKNIFSSCTELVLPEGLFDKCTKVTTFENAFWGTSFADPLPENLFRYNTEVTNFNLTFARVVGLTSIPISIFDYNRKARYFKNTFACFGTITGESPYTTIKVDGNDVKVHLYERSSYPEHFTAPASYTGCFNTAWDNVTDIEAIKTANWYN